MGQLGEASEDLHKFLIKCAKNKSIRMSHMFGRPPSDLQESQNLQHMRRRLSVCAIRAQSSCLLSRLGHMGSAAKSATERQSSTRALDEQMRKDLKSHWEAHV